MGDGELDTVLQQGCCSAPILQSPAIFLQQAISDCVICGLGRQANAVGAAHATTNTNASICRNLPIPKCYPVPTEVCKPLQVMVIGNPLEMRPKRPKSAYWRRKITGVLIGGS